MYRLAILGKRNIYKYFPFLSVLADLSVFWSLSFFSFWLFSLEEPRKTGSFLLGEGGNMDVVWGDARCLQFRSQIPSR